MHSALSRSEDNQSLELLRHRMKVMSCASRNERYRTAGHCVVNTGDSDHATARNDKVHLILSMWLLRNARTGIMPVKPQTQRRHSQKLTINRGPSQFGDVYDVHPDILSEAGVASLTGRHA